MLLSFTMPFIASFLHFFIITPLSLPLMITLFFHIRISLFFSDTLLTATLLRHFRRLRHTLIFCYAMPLIAIDIFRRRHYLFHDATLPLWCYDIVGALLRAISCCHYIIYRCWAPLITPFYAADYAARCRHYWCCFAAADIIRRHYAAAATPDTPPLFSRHYYADWCHAFRRWYAVDCLMPIRWLCFDDITPLPSWY